MKRLSTLLLFVGLMGWLSARAESCLVLLMRDGQTHSYVLSQQPRMTFGEGTLTMTAAEAEATFLLADVENFHFVDQEAAIRQVKAEGHCFGYVNGMLTVQGHEGAVMLTDLKGVLLASTPAGQPFAYDLKSQPKGTYVLRIGKQSIKLYNKKIKTG